MCHVPFMSCAAYHASVQAHVNILEAQAATEVASSDAHCCGMQAAPGGQSEVSSQLYLAQV